MNLFYDKYKNEFFEYLEKHLAASAQSKLAPNERRESIQYLLHFLSHVPHEVRVDFLCQQLKTFEGRATHLKSLLLDELKRILSDISLKDLKRILLRMPKISELVIEHLPDALFAQTDETGQSLFVDQLKFGLEITMEALLNRIELSQEQLQNSIIYAAKHNHFVLRPLLIYLNQSEASIQTAIYAELNEPDVVVQILKIMPQEQLLQCMDIFILPYLSQREGDTFALRLIEILKVLPEGNLIPFINQLPMGVVNAKDRSQMTALHALIAYKTNFNNLKFEQVLNAFLARDDIDLTQRNYKNETPLMALLANGSKADLSSIQRLIKQTPGSAINNQDGDGNTALHTLMRQQRRFDRASFERILKKILARKDIDFSIRNQKNQTVLDMLISEYREGEREFDTHIMAYFADESLRRESRLHVSLLGMEILLNKMNHLPYQEQCQALSGMSGGTSILSLAIEFHCHEHLELTAETQKGILKSPECLQKLIFNTPNPESWNVSVKKLRSSAFTTPVDLNLSGCFLSDKKLRSHELGYTHPVLRYFRFLPKNVKRMNLSGNEWNRWDARKITGSDIANAILGGLPNHVTNVAFNRNIFISRSLLIKLFGKNNFVKTISTLPLEEITICVDGIKENLVHLLQRNPKLIKELKAMPRDRRLAVLESFGSGTLKAMVESDPKNFTEFVDEMRAHPFVSEDPLQKELLTFLGNKPHFMLLGLFDNPGLNTSLLPLNTKSNLLNLLEKELDTHITPFSIKFSENFKNSGTKLHRYFNEPASSTSFCVKQVQPQKEHEMELLKAQMYCHEIDLLELPDENAYKQLLQNREKRAIFRALFQGGDVKAAFEDMSMNDCIVICHMLGPHLTLIMHHNPRMVEQIMTSKHREIIQRSFDSPFLDKQLSTKTTQAYKEKLPQDKSLNSEDQNLSI